MNTEQHRARCLIGYVHSNVRWTEPLEVVVQGDPGCQEDSDGYEGKRLGIVDNPEEGMIGLCTLLSEQGFDEGDTTFYHGNRNTLWFDRDQPEDLLYMLQSISSRLESYIRDQQRKRS